jgi:hypothetical protein
MASEEVFSHYCKMQTSSLFPGIWVAPPKGGG